MGHVLKVLILQVVGLHTALSVSFNVTCPEGALRKLRSKMFCADEKQYHCMYDTLKHAYVETCISARPIGEGKYSVLSGNLDVRECQQPFYSPYAESPVWSNDGHRCYYLRSLCNEEGQVTVSDGSSSTDRLCRCDYTRGYDYVTKPTDQCKCSPSAEDCSCFIKVCSRRYDILNQDYECEDRSKDEYRCSVIINQGYMEIPDAAADSSRETCNDCTREFTFESKTRPVTVPLLLCILTVLLLAGMKTDDVSKNPEEPKLDQYTSGQDVSVENLADTVPVIYHQYSNMEVVTYYERTKEICEINQAFEHGGRNKLIILRGIPGSGKTQAAHYYCEQEKRKYSIIAKIVATDSDSLFDTLKNLTDNIHADIIRDESGKRITTNILCNAIKTFLNDTNHSTLSYIFLVDNARLHDVKPHSSNQLINRLQDDLHHVLLLVKEVENLDMILTTNDSTFKETYDSVEIQFDGMEKEEYTKLLKRQEENGSFVEISEESLKELIQEIGNLPIIVNSARQYLITTGKSVREYLDTFRSFKPMYKLTSLDPFTSLFYKSPLLESQRVPLTYVKHNIMRAHGKELWDVMILLPFLQYESISTTVLEACYFHLMPSSKDTNKKGAIDTLLIECQKFSLCHFNRSPKSRFKFSDLCDDLDMSQSKNTIRYLKFHDVTMWALDWSDDNGDGDKEFQSNKVTHLEFLLKIFCFEIDIDARTDKTLQRNILFLPHASKLLRQLDESNVVETDEILFYKSYLHCAIGSTFLFGKTDVEAAHIHLVKSRSTCLKIVRDTSYFTKAVCIFQQVTTDTVERPTRENIQHVADLVFQKTFDANFVKDFVLGKRRSLNNVEAIKTTTKLKLALFKGHYLQEDEYKTLEEEGNAIPIEELRKILLGELLLRILLNNGRVLNEFLFSTWDRDKDTMLQNTCNTEFYNANEICQLLKEKYPSYYLFACLENDRTGRMLMRCSETNITTSQIDSDISFYKNMIKEPFDKCFNFGVLKMSRYFNDRHICMCRRILIRFLHLKYEKEHDKYNKIDIFEEGQKEVQLLQEKLNQMEMENRHHTWLTFPLFHIQCAKFLLLSQNSENEDTKKALELFKKATYLEESRGVFWTRYIHEGYHGSLLCLQKLKRQIEVDELVTTIEEKYSSKKTEIHQIKNLEYRRWCDIAKK